MNTSLRHVLLRYFIAILFVLSLTTACTQNGSMSTSPTIAPVTMPEGFNTVLLGIIDEGRRVRVYTQMNNIGDAPNDQLLFPPHVARQLGLTNKQMERRFMDLLLATNRFEVLDAEATGGVRNGAFQDWGNGEVDIVIDCLVTDARQEILSIRPYKKVRTQVKISIQMKDGLTGKNLFDGDVAVTGTWGDVQGEGTMIPPNVSLQTPAMQEALGNDYERALSKAFEAGIERIDQIVTPVGRITMVAGRGFSMFGGIQHGFQGGDEVVAFRAHRRKMSDGNERIVAVEPIARARCNGVGSDITNCVLMQIEPGQQILDSDYTVLSTESSHGVRKR